MAQSAEAQSLPGTLRQMQSLPQQQPQLQQQQHYQQQRQPHNRAQPAQQQPKKSGFFQGGLDALVSSISVLGDTLGQALEDGIQTVSTDLLLVPEKRPETAKTRRTPGLAAGATFGKSASRESGVPKTVDVGDYARDGRNVQESKPSLGSLFSFAERTTAPPKEQLDASRSVASAMAVRAKQLQVDLRKARKDMNQLQTRVSELEEENSRLKQTMAEGEHWAASETEEQLREQVEHLLLEKSSLVNSKREVERENEKLHQLVEYYERLHIDDENAGWEDTAVVTNGNLFLLDGHGSDITLSPLGTPLGTPLGSSSDLGYLGSTLSTENSGIGGSRSGSSAEASEVAAEEEAGHPGVDNAVTGSHPGEALKTSFASENREDEGTKDALNAESGLGNFGNSHGGMQEGNRHQNDLKAKEVVTEEAPCKARDSDARGETTGEDLLLKTEQCTVAN